jgi:hypothetical protein
MRTTTKLAIFGTLLAIGVASFIVQDRMMIQRWPSAVRLPDHGNTHNLVGKDWNNPSNHGWKDEIPTANSPTSLGTKN